MKNSAFSVQLRNENRANFRKLGKRELSLRGTIGGRQDDWRKGISDMAYNLRSRKNRRFDWRIAIISW